MGDACQRYDGPTEKDPLLSSVDVVSPTRQRCSIPIRYVVTFMAFLGFFNVYAMRVNLSVGLVAMVNYTDTLNVTDTCPEQSNSTKDTKEGPYDWDSIIQGQILASFFYGYIITQIPGGFIAGRYGAKWVLGLGVLCTTILTLLTPLAASISPYALMALRVLEGLGEGVTYPSAHALFAKWSPPLERSTLMSITYSGSYFGTAVFLPIAGLLCSSDFLGGWPAVFYISGVMGLVWFVFWCLLVSSTPAGHWLISEEELRLITSSLEDKQVVRDVPWKSIFTSTPVWAIVVANFCGNWAFYTLLTDLPTYLKNILKFDISQNGILSSLPYLAQWFVTVLSGYLADLMRRRQLLTTTATRKMFNSLGFLIQACFLVGAGLAGCNVTIAVACLIGTTAACGLTMAGYTVNHLDIAPGYAGVLMGISNTVGTIPGFLGPSVASFFTNKSQDKQSWMKIFVIAAVIAIIGMVVFQLFASGVQQDWAKDKKPKPINSSEESEVKSSVET